MCFFMKYNGFLMEIGDQNGAKINEKQGSNEKNVKAKNLEKPLFFLCFLEILTLQISLEIAIFTTKSYQINCLDSIHEFKYLLAQLS